MNPRPLTDREQRLIDRYSYCQLGMTPQTFYAKWHVSQEAVAKPVRSTYRGDLFSLYFHRALLVSSRSQLSSSYCDRPSSPCPDGLSAGALRANPKRPPLCPLFHSAG